MTNINMIGGYVVAIGLVSILGGCKLPWESDIAELRAEVAALKSEFKNISDPRVTLQSHEETLQDLYLRMIKAESHFHDLAEFDPAEKRFQRVDSQLQTFYVSVQDVKPYGDGQRIVLHIGNPSSASFNNIGFKIKWASRPPELSEKNWIIKFREWGKTKKEKEVTITESLNAGSWSRTVVTIAPAKAEQFGWLEISELDTPQTELRKAR